MSTTTAFAVSALVYEELQVRLPSTLAEQIVKLVETGDTKDFSFLLNGTPTTSKKLDEMFDGITLKPVIVGSENVAGKHLASLMFSPSMQSSLRLREMSENDIKPGTKILLSNHRIAEIVSALSTGIKVRVSSAGKSNDFTLSEKFVHSCKVVE